MGTKIEVYELEDSPDGPQGTGEVSYVLDMPPYGPPAVGDKICMASIAVPPGDNPYVIDAYFEVVARTHTFSPIDRNGKLTNEHKFSAVQITVKRILTADIRSGKKIV